MPSIETFGIISTHFLFAHDRLLISITAISLAAGQIIYALPKYASNISTLSYIALLLYLVQFASHFSIMSSPSSKSDFSHAHPIEALIHNSREDFNGMLTGQSKNYASAETEYRRRYGIEPPPGYREWYRYAVTKQSHIIDDFDIMYDAISPFWKVSGKQVIAAMDEVLKVPSHELWRCKFVSRTGKTRCTHPTRTNDRNIGISFNEMLGTVRGILPDSEFLINHLDEPRMIFPPATLSDRLEKQQNTTISDLSEKSTWENLTAFCPSTLGHEYTFGQPRPSLLVNRTSAMNICQHPEYQHMHGLFTSPTSFKLINGTVPVLSTGAPSTMGDVLFPSPAYMETQFKYEAFNDIEWGRKRNKLYWAGSTTGGYASDETQWQHLHRQRFIARTQSIHNSDSVRGQQSGMFTNIKSFFNKPNLFDVAFTSISQCAAAQCASQAAFFSTKTMAHKDHAFQSTLAFDLDGNGISGRFYKLLASRSVPFKQTILREWHNDRLMPWVHYVPVTLGMDELEDLVSFFTGSSAGRKRAQEIADAGREWYFKGLRGEDRSVYVFRLLLEVARLRDPTRLAS